MTEITIRLHPKLAEGLLANEAKGAQIIASLSHQAAKVMQRYGRHITYAPLVLQKGAGCAMSVRGGARGAIIEIDAPDTLIVGRGVVIDRQYKSRGNMR